MQAYRLLVIDDEADICELFKEVGEECDYDVSTAMTTDDFQRLYVSQNPTFIIVDLQLGNSDGVELLRFLAANQCQVPIALMSGADEKILSIALHLGKTHGLKMVTSLQKPFKVAMIAQLLQQSKLNTNEPSAEQIVKAMEKNEFVLNYQVQASFQTRQVIGVETLVRWQTADKKSISPDVFIPIAEKNGLIMELTRATMKKAFLQCATWRQQNIVLKVAINLSANSLTDLLLPDELSFLAAQFKIDPTQITFEITETDVMSKPDIAMDILTRLRLKGFSLAVDDFGTGYSSFIQLYRMPFNEIKIDKSFVMNLENDNEAQVITKSIVDLAHNLKLSAIAEGVESKKIWDMLVAMNCDIAQGYYLSPPLRAEDFIIWLKNNTDQNLKLIRS